MLNFLYKATMLIICINAMVYFIAGNSIETKSLGSQFGWVSPAFLNNQAITNTSQVGVTGINVGDDTNANLQQSAITNTTNILHFEDFLTVMGSMLSVIAYFLFGFMVWMPMIMPYPFWVLFVIPLFFVQIVGLFTLFQGIVGIMIFAIKSFI